MNDNNPSNDTIMMVVGLMMVVIAAVTMLAADGAMPIPLATIGIVFLAIGARRRRIHS